MFVRGPVFRDAHPKSTPGWKSKESSPAFSSSPRVWKRAYDATIVHTHGEEWPMTQVLKKIFLHLQWKRRPVNTKRPLYPTSTWSSKKPPISRLKIGCELPNLAIKKWASGYRKWSRLPKKARHCTVQTIKQGIMSTKKGATGLFKWTDSAAFRRALEVLLSFTIFY